MDFTKIPENKHMLVKDGFYDLRFEVENVPMTASDADMLDANQHDGDHNDDSGFADDGARPDDQNNPNGGLHENGDAKQDEGQGKGNVRRGTKEYSNSCFWSNFLSYS
jgi:hypothetical protein